MIYLLKNAALCRDAATAKTPHGFWSKNTNKITVARMVFRVMLAGKWVRGFCPALAY
jgi:hypothetical protein